MAQRIDLRYFNSLIDGNVLDHGHSDDGAFDAIMALHDANAKAGDPHGADEHQAQRVIRVLEFLVQVLIDDPLAVGPYVETLGVHISRFVLSLGDDNRYVDLFHLPDTPLQRGTLNIGC